MPAILPTICPSCGFKNPASSTKNRCASCGVKIEEFRRTLPPNEELARRYHQTGFSLHWFWLAIGIQALITFLVLYILPMLLPVFDFEGQVGMMLCIPIWFVGGFVIAILSPRQRTMMESVCATLLVALPAAFLLHKFQTVKTMPGFMYVLLSALGLLFTLVGGYAGERLQLGSRQRSPNP